MTTLRTVRDTGAPGSGAAAAAERIASRIVGRERELELALATVAAGRDLL